MSERDKLKSEMKAQAGGENTPEQGADNDLKATMKEQSQVLESIEVTPDADKQAQEILMNMVRHPVKNVDNNRRAEIGSFRYHRADTIVIEREKNDFKAIYEENSVKTNKPDNVLDRSKLYREGKRDRRGIASYVANRDVVDISGHSFEDESMFGQIEIALHEYTHREHNLRANYHDLVFEGNVNGYLRAEQLTESTALAVEALSCVNMYASFKEQGMKTIEVDGKERPIECILDDFDEHYLVFREVEKKYGGISFEFSGTELKKLVTEKGFEFDPNNENSVRAVVEVVSKYWNDSRKDDYKPKRNNIIDRVYNTMPFTDKLEFLSNKGNVEKTNKEYDEVAEKMLKGMYIGHNTSVDLSHCRDLLDVATNEYVFDYVFKEKREKDLPCMQEVNKYMEEKGIISDRDKNEYFAKFVENVANRKQPVDEQMLKIVTSYTDGKIMYADGIEETFNKDGTSTFVGNGTKCEGQSTYNVFGVKYNEAEMDALKVALKGEHADALANQQVGAKGESVVEATSQPESKPVQPQVPVAMMYAQRER